MSFEYDLVVIGASQGGIYAAMTAAKSNARVALVEQDVNYHSSGEAEAIYSRSLSLIDCSTIGDNISFREWVEEVISTIATRNSPAKLAALGVDYIQGKGKFSQNLSLNFIVNQRLLRGRNYLIATGTLPEEINITQETSYLKLQDIWQLESLKSLPQNLVLVGTNPVIVELAQNLTTLGKNISLVVSHHKVLSQEDWEISQLLQAQLEAEGIKIYTQSPVSQIKEIEGKKWVQAGNQAIEADEIIFTSPRKPNLTGLNIEATGADITKKGIKVNKKLQTNNPRIYACGDILGGYNFPHIARHEADLVLKNAFASFSPHSMIDYSYVPWVIFTKPNIARVGLTQHQARLHCGDEVISMKQYFKNLPQAQLKGDTTGFCKLITRRDGEILGAHIMGDNAGEIINVFALAIRNGLKVKDFASLPQPNLTSAQIIELITQEWQWHHGNHT